jgi:hypothetical protein
MTADEREQLGRTAADALLTAWPETEEDAALAEILRSNADALCRHAPDSLWRPNTHSLLFRVGRSLGESDRASVAASYFEKLAEAAGCRLGPDHLDALTARHELAYWQGEAGDPTAATTTLTKLLTDAERALGPNHPHTLTTRHELAYWQGEWGQPGGPSAGRALRGVEDKKRPRWTVLMSWLRR